MHPAHSADGETEVFPRHCILPSPLLEGPCASMAGQGIVQPGICCGAASLKETYVTPGGDILNKLQEEKNPLFPTFPEPKCFHASGAC